MNKFDIERNYRNDINIIKTLAIIAVVFYHILGKKCSTGYLGVDVFFVVSGFLIIPKVADDISGEKFHYIKFLIKRLVRMLPLLIISSWIVVIIALLFMVPEDLLTVAESAVASVLFINNYLSLYLCADYWDWTNEFKPLMHTWYAAVLMQLCVIIPLLMLVASKIMGKNESKRRSVQTFFLVFLGVASLLYFALSKRNELQFYLISARAYEFVFGGVAGILCKNRSMNDAKQLCHKVCWTISAIAIVVFLTIGFSGREFENDILVPMVVLCTVICAWCGESVKAFDGKLRFLGIPGKASYSIFIWHQIVLALYRYYISCKYDTKFWVLYVAILIALTYVSYRYIENTNVFKSKKVFATTVAAVLLLGILCAVVWLRAGVLYNIPELDINVEYVERRKNPHYVDRIYELDKPFETKDKIKVLVVGNSFARDFANTLLESKWADKIEVKYSFGYDAGEERVTESDFVFVYGLQSSLPEYYWEQGKVKNKVYGIGTKNFGECIGQYFIHRRNEHYFEQTGEIKDDYVAFNEELAKEWGKHYINIIEYLKTGDGRIKIFTDDNRYISYDMHHLAKAGAEYLGSIIDFDAIFMCE